MAPSEHLPDKAIKAALKAAAEAGRARKLSAGGGLLLDVRPTGSGWWRLRCWCEGNECMLSLGTYPEVTLKLARERRDAARRDQAAGVDLSEAR